MVIAPDASAAFVANMEDVLEVYSWLDMAESELGVLSIQCLDRRFPDKQMLTSEVVVWERPSRQSRLAIHNRRRPH
jgi:hypothetical protein